MGFRSLQVLAEDIIQPAGVFPWHRHQDVEILTYVASGTLAQRNQHGHQVTLRAGEFGRVTAGTGIVHSDLNPSEVEPAHGLTPSVEHRAFPRKEQHNIWRLVASHDGRDGSLTVHQDVEVLHALLAGCSVLHHHVRPGCGAWVQLVAGVLWVNNIQLHAGDGLEVSAELNLTCTADEPSDVLLFDLA
jgi:redox-sensitive bicupin YhaK (pirin superfamily)